MSKVCGFEIKNSLDIELMGTNFEDGKVNNAYTMLRCKR